MRVLHLIPNFTGGGAERQLALLAPELSRLGLEVHIGFCEPGLNSETNLGLLATSDVKLHLIHGRNAYDPAILLKLVRLIRSVRPDVIQTWILQMDVLGGLAAMFSALPFVVSERCSAPMYPGTWKHWLRIHVGQRAATIVANSASGAMYWKPWASRIEVVRNGFSSSLIKEASAADPAIFGFPSSSKLILFAGRLSSQKNIHVLIEALDEVLTKKEDCVALVFGEGELRQTIQSHLTMLWSRDRIRLPGYTNQLSNWMRRSSVFVSISLYEGHPNVILEAMAIGCPLVVSDIPEHREILDDARAVFCSPHSAIEVAAAISKILEDPVSASTQAGLAREAVMDWSVHEAARRYWKIYEGVLSREQPSTLRTRLSSLLKM